MATIDYQEEVLRRLGRREGQAQTVIFNAIIAPSRSGSTRTGLLFYETNADLVVTEPAARFDDGDGRWGKLWEFFYRQIIALEKKAAAEGRDLAKQPLRIVSKFISHHIGPIHEADAILDMHEKIVFLVRGPIEAIESNIIMIAGLFEVMNRDAVEGVGCFPLTIADMKDHGWVNADTDLSHLVESYEHPDGKSVWRQHIDHIQRTRDYRSLTMRAWVLHHGVFSTPSLQREVWEYQRQQLALGGDKHAGDRIAASCGYGTWEALVEAHLGADNVAMLDETFPPVLREPFLYRQAAWNALEELYERAQRYRDKYRVYDFGLIKLLPEQMAARLVQEFGLEYRAPAEGEEVAFITGYGAHLERRPGMEDWIFGEAKKKGEIYPYFKRLIEIERFPAFMRRDILENQMRIYLKMLSDPSLATPEGVSSRTLIAMRPHKEQLRLRDVDPVYSYVLVQVIADMPPRLKNAVLANIAERESRFGGYFDAVDRICQKELRKVPRVWHMKAGMSQAQRGGPSGIARKLADLRQRAATSPTWATGQFRTAADILTMTSGLVTNPSVGRFMAGLIGIAGSRVLSIYGDSSLNRELMEERAVNPVERFVMRNPIQVSNILTIAALTSLLSSGITALGRGDVVGGMTETSLAIYIMTAFVLKAFAPELAKGESLLAELKHEGVRDVGKRLKAWAIDSVRGPANVGVGMLQGSGLFMLLDAVVRGDVPRVGSAALLMISNVFFGRARRSDFTA